jgi:hypothetical protein
MAENVAPGWLNYGTMPFRVKSVMVPWLSQPKATFLAIFAPCVVWKEYFVEFIL